MTLDQPRFAGFQRHRHARDLSPGEHYLEPVRANIATYGWHIQQVYGDAGRFGWSYTIGFGDSFGLPDLVVFGLDPGVAHVLLNNIGDAIAEGQPLSEGARHEGFLENLAVQFRRTLPRWHAAHFGQAKDWYGAYPSMWQVVIPDAHNRFPGDPGEESSNFQLLLSNERPAPTALHHPNTPIDLDEGWEALVPDRMGNAETGWEERLVLTRGSDPSRWVVASVPFVEHISFGDEVEAELDAETLRITRTTQYAPFATARVGVIQGGDETQQRLSLLIDMAEANGIPWESPVVHWFFFAVPHHRYAWFLEATEPLRRDGLVSLTCDRPPAP